MRKVLLLIYLALAVFIQGCSTDSSTKMHQLSMMSDPAEGGVLLPGPGEFEDGKLVEITASSNEHWIFYGWGGDLSGDQNPVNLSLDSDKNIIGIFKKKDYPLIIENTEGGEVQEKVLQQKTSSYSHGTVLELTAIPHSGWKFSQWGGSVEGTENPVIVTVDGEFNVKAFFEVRVYPLTTSVIGKGSVSDELVQVKSTDYSYGDQVKIEAHPDPGWYFVRWEGGMDGNENPVLLSIEDETEITAVFEQNEYTLTVNIEGKGEVDQNVVQSKSEDYLSGTSIELTAKPEKGWKFTGWSGGHSGKENPLEVNMDGDTSVTAHFERNVYNVSIAKNGEGMVAQTLISGTENNKGYEFESVVKFEATPKDGWSFTGWSGDATGNENPLSIQIKKNVSLTANFQQETAAIKIAVKTSGDDIPSEYTVFVNGISKSVKSNGNITLNDLPFGSYEIELSDVPEHCTVSNQSPLDVNLSASGTKSIEFSVVCQTNLSGKILFQSNKDGKPGIYGMNPDGTGVYQFSNALSILLYPRKDPGSDVIAFSEPDFLQECTETRIVIKNANGSHHSNFTGYETCTEHLYPSWSTNGNKIAYISVSPSGYTEAAIYKMRPDGSDKEQIKSFDSGIITLKGLDWSPIEGKLVYSYEGDLFVMTSDGDNNTNLTSNFSYEATNPRWSPDAKKILFTAKKDGVDEIYVLNANGSTPINLTNKSGHNDSYASWSPDGKHIVFMSDRNGLSDIFIMKADGSSQINITNSASANDRNPEWIID